jgi:transporter family-2 protein
MLLAVLAGAFQPLQAAVNSGLAQRGATVIWASAISATVSVVTLVAAALFIWRLPPPSLRTILSTPPIYLTGGALGAVILLALTFVAPKLGTALTFVCFLAGVTACSLALDQFGALGLPQQALTPGRAIGAGLIVVAVTLVRFF